MNWNQLWDALRKQGTCSAGADCIIGSLMDSYESYDWNAEIPKGADDILH